MIASFAEFLLELKKKEEALLGMQDIKHAPTIGSMYEGLSKELLNRAIPPHLDLRLVDGFLRDAQGNLSPQLDCMVATGEGDRIPHTDSYVWDIDNVLAIFEIKKNLYSTEMSDACPKLQEVSIMFIEAWADGRKRPIDRSAKPFEMTTGVALPHASEIENFDIQLKQIFHTIFFSEHAPLRILLGYRGFVSEYGLREGFVRYLEKFPRRSRGVGLRTFPNQIICGMNSIIVAGGHPYCAPLIDGKWAAVLSSSENPLRILIEMLWTKICSRFGLSMPDDDSLIEESFSPLLFAKAVKTDQDFGWHFQVNELSKEDLAERKPLNWEPVLIDMAMAAILTLLSRNGSIELDQPEFLESLEKNGKTRDQVVNDIVSLGLGAVKGETLHQVQGFVTVFLPDGRVAVSFEQDKLRLWMARSINRSERAAT
ncbi:MAG: hypothetical protein QOJ15_4254 [Bradyrhizobium sp.]|jgi:hypothetical protein|nr:hypothetical protein [Bradyrhizobium sp.]